MHISENMKQHYFITIVITTEKGASDPQKPSTPFWKFRNANFILKWASKMDRVWMSYEIIMRNKKIRCKTNSLQWSMPERLSHQRKKLYLYISIWAKRNQDNDNDMKEQYISQLEKLRNEVTEPKKELKIEENIIFNCIFLFLFKYWLVKIQVILVAGHTV